MLQSLGEGHGAMRESAFRWHAGGVQQCVELFCIAVCDEMGRVLTPVARRGSARTVTLQSWVIMVQENRRNFFFAECKRSEAGASSEGGGCNSLHAVADGLQLDVRCTWVHHAEVAPKRGVVVTKRVKRFANKKWRRHCRP